MNIITKQKNSFGLKGMIGTRNVSRKTNRIIRKAIWLHNEIPKNACYIQITERLINRDLSLRPAHRCRVYRFCGVCNTISCTLLSMFKRAHPPKF